MQMVIFVETNQIARNDCFYESRIWLNATYIVHQKDTQIKKNILIDAVTTCPFQIFEVK